MQPTDPLYPQQWHFTKLGNIEKIWDEFSGAGIHIGVYDGGVALDHPDLAGNYDPSREVVIDGIKLSGAVNIPATDPNETPAHGTAVAGLITASANNGEGIVGAAWGASLTGINIFDTTSPIYLRSADFTDFRAAFHQMTNFEVTNHSWNGPSIYDPLGNLYGSGFTGSGEFDYASANGRGGLGTVIVQSATNQNLDAQGEGMNVSRFTITVAGTQQDGFAADFSNYGACVLVTAPAVLILTTDIPSPIAEFDGKYSRGSGTSFSAPLVSGVAALMLDANPNLGWRDVQNIIAASATHTGSAIGAVSPGTNENSNWLLNAAANWNGGGMHFSNDYGYGALNAYNAVRMAEVWSLFAPAQVSANEQGWENIDSTDYAIPDNGVFQTSILLTPIPAIDIEHVELSIDLTHTDYTQLRIFLVAPSGTEMQLYDGSGGSETTADGFFNWTYGGEALRGEDAAGTWTLRIVDSAAGETGTLLWCKVLVNGAAGSTGDVYHYTDEFLAMAALAGESGRTTLADTNGGSDWIDAAAVTGNVALNLATGATVNGVGWFTLAGGTVIENAATGDGNDTLTGSALDNILWGGRGDDTAVFSGSLSNYAPQDLGLRIAISGLDGSDTLYGFEHLQFTDGTVNVNDGNQLFDTLFYMHSNLDVFHAGVDALFHYNVVGFHEGRDPNALFDTSGYLAVYKDVAAAGINPLAHYHQSGWHEGRDPSAGFDTTLYLLRNPDVAAAGIDPLAHYLAAGRAEGRAAYQAIGTAVNGFDAEFYLFHNPDVAAAGVDPFFHYSVAGWHEGRGPNAWFDTSGYLSHYTDVAAAGIDPLFHYMAVGWTEGRDASTGFDTLGYLAANPDVAAAGVNPLDHYLRFGIYEGRAAINDGLWH
jgi:subtilisin-like proprotein convertase family protein